MPHANEIPSQATQDLFYTVGSSFQISRLERGTELGVCMSDDLAPFALVADDDAIIRMDAADILAEAGFRVYEASGHSDAVEILKTVGQNIQLLFTDVHMPPSELNGFDLAHSARSFGLMFGS